MRRSALLLGLVIFLSPVPVLAEETRLLDGPTIWSNALASPIFDQAEKCGLHPERLTINQEEYQALPETDAERAELEARVAAVSAAAGFGKNPASQQVSREFIRNMLISRMILRLDYSAKGGEEGMSCLVEWLNGEGFVTITEDEAEAISDARNDL